MLEVFLHLALQMHLVLTVEFRSCSFSFVRLIRHLLRLPVSPQGKTLDLPETVLQRQSRRRTCPCIMGQEARPPKVSTPGPLWLA